MTTDGCAARTCGSRAMRGSGAFTPPAPGPVTDGNGSNRASALRRSRDGRTSLSAARIAERWMSRRRLRAPGVWSAIAPTTHATPRPTAAISTAPISPSTIPNPGARRRTKRSRSPIPSNPDASTAPASNAPPRPKSGAYGESAPSLSSSGPSRVPMNAPAAKPARVSAPARKPCA